MFEFLKQLFAKGPEIDFADLVRKGAMIIDVRSPAEFQTGHIKGSINIPVDQISKKASDLKKKNKAIITCCLSGGRSGSARSILAAAGIECYNGGPWQSLQSKL